MLLTSTPKHTANPLRSMLCSSMVLAENWRWMGRPIEGRVFSVSCSRVGYWMKRLGFASVHFTSHSFRRGGASQLLRRGVGFEDICLFGRWASTTSAREYIRRGEVFVMMLRGDIASTSWRRVSLLASLGANVWDYQSGDIGGECQYSSVKEPKRVGGSAWTPAPACPLAPAKVPCADARWD